MPDSNITLDEYARIIVKPMVLAAISDGRLDDVLNDPDVLLIALKDEDIKEAVFKRIPIILSKPSIFELYGNEIITNDLKIKMPND